MQLNRFTKLYCCGLIFITLLLRGFETKASDYFWVNGTGKWSDCSNHWATTSGGNIFHTAIPTPSDDVYFDINSFPNPGDTVYANLILMYCKNMNWNGVTNFPVFYSGFQNINSYYFKKVISISGSLFISDSVNVKLHELNFTSTQPGNVIKSHRQAYDSVDIKFSGINGEWQLLDSMGANTGPSIYMINGTLKTNSNTVNCFLFYTSYEGNPTAIELDSSIINCFAWEDTDSAACNLNSINSSINCIFEINSINRSYKKVNAIRNGSLNSCVVSKIEGGVCQVVNCTVNTVHLKTSFLSTNSFISDVFLYDTLVNFSTNGGIINRVTIQQDATVSGSAQIDSLFFNTPGSVLTIYASFSVNNMIGFHGTCDKPARIEQNLYNPGVTAFISKSSDTLSLDHVFIKDVSTSGGANFFVTNSFTDGICQGWNVTLPPPGKLYWVGNAGNWNNMSHWALSSGGAGGNCPPTLFDSVFFDGNSFSSPFQSISLDQPLNFCKNLDFSGANKPIFNGNKNSLYLYGSLILTQGMAFNYTQLDLKSVLNNNIIKTEGVILDSVFIMLNDSGTYIMQDSLSMRNASVLSLRNGTFNTNNHNLHCDVLWFGWQNKANINLGSSQIFCKDFFAADSSNLQMQAQSSFIYAESSFNSNGRHIYKYINCGYAITGSGDSIKKMECSGLNSGHTFIDTLIFNHTDAWYNGELWSFDSEINHAFFHTKVKSFYTSLFHHAIFDSSAWFRYSVYFDTAIFLFPGSVITIGDTMVINNFLNSSGNCSAYLTIKSNEEGNSAFISKTGGVLTLDKAILKDIEFIGSATFTATNSFDFSNVSGIIVSPPSARSLYWVGNTGDWNDPAHWSAISGGPSGSCVPTKIDSVFFDVNSFASASDTVYVTQDSIYCKNMTWTGSNQPIIYGPINNLKIYGSLTLEAGMNFNISTITFESTIAGNSLTSKGQGFNNVTLNFTNGEWNLMDSIAGNPGPRFNITGGIFNTNNQKITCIDFNCSGPFGLTTLILGSSLINCHNWNVFVPVDADSASILTDSTFYVAAGVYNDISCNNFIAFGNAKFNQVTCGDMQLEYSTVNSAVIGGRLYTIGSLIKTAWLNGPNYGGYILISCGNTVINKAVVTERPYFRGNPEFDTLSILGPDLNMVIDGSLKVNKSLYVNSQLSNPAFIFSGVPGDTSFLYAPPYDTVCLDYIYLKDIHTNDSAVFYAGANSIDLGGNAGWVWSGCTPDTSNVWPGDANYDLVADNTDLLYIGLGYGYTGSVRPGATLNWTAQTCTDWQQQFANTGNLKHADCDGNGIIDAYDTLAVILNYGLTHPFKSPDPITANNFGYDLYLDLPSGPLVPGSIVSIPVMFGTISDPVPDFYGLALTINYDTSIVQPGSMQIDFTNSWGGNSFTLGLSKDLSNGSLDASFVRTDHQTASGYGVFAMLTFTLKNTSGNLDLAFFKITALNNYEIPIPVYGHKESIYTIVNEEPSLENLIAVYPNPASEKIFISDPNKIIEAVELYDPFGRPIYEDHFAKMKTINVSHLPGGIYILKINTSKGILYKKVVVKG